MAIAWISGSSKNFSDGTAWVGGVAPTSADDVTVSGTGTLTIDGTSGTPNECKSIDFTGFTGTVTHAANKYLNCYGSFKMVSGCTYTPAATAVLQFLATATGKQVTFGGKTFPLTNFSGVGGEWKFQDSAKFPTSSSGPVTHTDGILDLNGQNITQINKFTSASGNTRQLKIDGSTITYAANSAAWDLSNPTGLTFSATGSTIALKATTTIITFDGGGQTYGTVTNSLGSGITTGSVTFTGANTFAALNLPAQSGPGSYIFAADQIITGTFTVSGTGSTTRAFIKSSDNGVKRTISAATFTFSNMDMMNIIHAGAGSSNISAITGGSGDCGGNEGWTFTSPVTQYWVPSGGTGTGNTGTTTRWATSDGGTAGTGRIPLPQDICKFTANSFNGAGQTVTEGLNRVGTRDFTGATNSPTWAKPATALYILGDVTFESGMTFTGSTSTLFAGKNSHITSAGVTWPGSWAIDCGSSSGCITFVDKFIPETAATKTYSSGSVVDVTNPFAPTGGGGGSYTFVG